MKYSTAEKNIAIDTVRNKYTLVSPYLNERSRRIWVATEAKSYGFGGSQIVKTATGISFPTIKKGLDELKSDITKRINLARVRKEGAGRKSLEIQDVNLTTDIQNIVEASTRGDPEATLLWSSKSVRKIADEINKEMHRVCHKTVAIMLGKMGYSLQGNRKIKEGANHPDRDAQFNFINEKTKEFQKRNQPVISVDTKKKELIGEFKNAGQEYCKKGHPIEVNTYDFIDKDLGKAAPYGVYDLSQNNGWVSVGISSDTAEFAVNSIRNWWFEMGEAAYKNATEIYINADGGGSNGTRVRMWKTELQKFANEIGKVIHVSHFPPGTSKWNKIEHKMFCFISKNWRGRPLVDTATIVQLIANTTTTKGLTIKAKLDKNEYLKGIKISDAELAQVSITPNAFHGEWNYAIHPQN